MQNQILKILVGVVLSLKSLSDILVFINSSALYLKCLSSYTQISNNDSWMEIAVGYQVMYIITHLHCWGQDMRADDQE